MTTKIYLTLIICSFLISCSRTSEQLSLPVITIDPSKVEKGYDIADKLDGDFKIAVLETTDNSLISYVDNMVYQNDMLYVFDSQGNSVFMFDSDGKYVKKLYKQGQGPDEYASLALFAFDGTNIWVTDNTQGNLLVYNDSLKLINRMNMIDMVIPDDMKFIGNKLCLASIGSSGREKNWVFGTYDVTTGESECYLYAPKQDEKTARFKKDNQIAILDQSCLFIQSYCDTIFEMKDDTFYPAYKFVFTERYKDIPRTIEEIMNTMDHDNTIIGIENMKQTENEIILGYFDVNDEGARVMKTAIYDKKEKKCVVYDYLMNSFLADLPLWQNAVFFENDAIVTCYDPDSLIEFFTEENLAKISDESNRTKIKNMLSSIDEYSNPVVFIYKTKSKS